MFVLGVFFVSLCLHRALASIINAYYDFVFGCTLECVWVCMRACYYGFSRSFYTHYFVLDAQWNLSNAAPWRYTPTLTESIQAVTDTYAQVLCCILSSSTNLCLLNADAADGAPVSLPSLSPLPVVTANAYSIQNRFTWTLQPSTHTIMYSVFTHRMKSVHKNTGLSLSHNTLAFVDCFCGPIQVLVVRDVE